MAVSLVRRVAARLKVAAGRSRVVGRLPTQGTDGNSLAGEPDESTERTAAVQSRGWFVATLEGSVLGRWVTGSGSQESQLTATIDRSRVTGGVRSLRQYVTGSFVYRWLTAEPDPDVIVIDLRETRTVGPILSVLDTAVTTAIASLPTSSVGAVGRAITTRVRARPIRAVSLLLLPVVVLSSLGAATTGVLTPALAVAHLLFAVIGLLGMRSRLRLEELLETRTVQVVCAAFEPPEPPERSERTHTGQQPCEDSVDDGPAKIATDHSDPQEDLDS